MPIYEYKCQNCGEHLEAMQKISDAPLSECPKCGGRLEKQWSRSGFQFKGSGWYVTDYAGKSGDAKSEAKSETKTETASSSTTETKSSGGEGTKSGDGASKTETKSAA